MKYFLFHLNTHTTSLTASPERLLKVYNQLHFASSRLHKRQLWKGQDMSEKADKDIVFRILDCFAEQAKKVIIVMQAS